jgi:hypothetical protein
MIGISGLDASQVNMGSTPGQKYGQVQRTAYTIAMIEAQRLEDFLAAYELKI